MAQNPMQRKMTNSFLLGMFLTLLIAAVVVGLLLTKINSLNKDKEELENSKVTITKSVYVATETIPEGSIAYGVDDQNGTTIQKISIQSVSTSMTEGLITAEDLETYNETTGQSTMNVMKAKIEIPAGTVITKAMLENVAIDDTERLMEYNMISLPSQLLESTYIDVRILLPSGEDFVVVSKKYVEQVDYTTIWLRMSEYEIETLSNAIIESYIIDGAKLYATTYTSPTSQAASKCTYVPSSKVQDIIKAMASDDATKAAISSWTTYAGVRDRLQNYLNGYDEDEQKEKTAEGIEKEKTELQSARDTFLQNMGY